MGGVAPQNTTTAQTNSNATQTSASVAMGAPRPTAPPQPNSPSKNTVAPVQPSNSTSSTDSSVSATATTSPAIPNTPTSTTTPVASDALASTEEQIMQLLWPIHLMAEIAETRKDRFWSTPLALVNFIIMSIIGFILGPMQLVLLVVKQDYTYVTESYAPSVMRVSLLISGALAISTIVAMIRAWKEQPKRSLMTAILGTGTVIIGAIIWLAAFIVKFEPNQIAFLLTLAIIASAVAVIITARHYYSPDESAKPLEILFIVVITFAGLETLFGGIYLFTQTNNAEEFQLELEALGKAQATARLNGINEQLSDLVYTVCSGNYDAVYVPVDNTDRGIFECRDSHRVYAISGPNEPVTETSSVISGAAFYFGTTSDELVSTYFPADTGAKYLYRNLGDTTDDPSELVLLLNASTEEVLINSYLDQIIGFLNARPSQSNLILSMFYNNELNSVITTRDFILIAAQDTIAQNPWLPTGTNLRGYINGRYGTFIYTPDHQLEALKSLAGAPLLYSAQTREALTNHRHITVLLEGNHEYTNDELRELLYANLVDPLTTQQNTTE